MTIIAISNQKGGVGKTTTTANLAHAIVSITNSRVLLLDLDPQGNLGTTLGIEYGARDHNVYTLMCYEYSDQEIFSKFIVSTYIPRLDIIPSNMDLAAFNVEVVNIRGKEFILANKLHQIKDKYDYILIDCPPTLNILSINALVAADCLLIPMQCEYLSLEGLVQLMHITSLIQQNFNPTLQFLGVLLTMYDKRNNLSHSIVQEVKDYLGYKVFDTLIPRSVKISEAQSHGKTIITYDNKSNASINYKNLAKELIMKLKKNNKT